MREILFRGKRTDNKGWIEGLLTIMWGQYHIINPSDENTAYPIDPETVCQYTGLTDKNGRKIFEGDIVRYIDEVIGKEKVDEVKYNETHATFCRLHKGILGLQYLFIDESFTNKCEDIGNIFDNPELITEDV